MTNTGTTRANGTTSIQPFMTLSREGIVAWHSNGAIDSRGVLVDLAPGESISYPVSVTPVVCDATDELAQGFRDNLPPIGPGQIVLSAVIGFFPDSSSVGREILVTGPPEIIELQ